MSNHDFSSLNALQQCEEVVQSTRSATLQLFKKRKYGITSDQWKVIEAVGAVETPTQSNIAAESGKDPAAVTRMIVLLEKKDLISRKATKADKRSHHIVLTRKGKALAKKVAPAMEKLVAGALTDISSRDLSTLKRISQTIANNLS